MTTTPVALLMATLDSTHQEGLLPREGYDSALLLPVLLGLVEGLLVGE